MKTLAPLIPLLALALTVPAAASDATCDSVVLPAAAESPVGSWTVTDTVCMTVPDMGAMIIPGCQGSTQDITMTTTGTATFTASGESGGTYTRAFQRTTSGELRVPLSCLTTAGMPCDGEGPMGMAVTQGEFCVIEMNQTRPADSVGVWTIEGNTVTVTANEEGAEPQTLTIYADPEAPGTMLVETLPAPGAAMVMELERVEQ